MRVCFVSDGAPSAEMPVLEQADLYVFGALPTEVSYERELKGETRFFEDVARLSKRERGVVVCGCLTDTRGHKRKSAVVAERGKLMGVSDMLHAIDHEIACGAGLRVYETQAGKIGVAVADDLRFPSVIHSLVVCGSDCIVCPIARIQDIHSVLARSHAYCFGVPILLCGRGYALVASSDGKIAFATPLKTAVFDVKTTKEYHLVETRRRLTCLKE